MKCEEREHIERQMVSDLALITASSKPRTWIFEEITKTISRLAQHIATCPKCKGEQK